MQVQKQSNAKTLQQGSIFSIASLILKNSEDVNCKLFGKGGFYPEVTSNPSDLGIVLTQSCDIYKNSEEKRKPKVPYFTIAVLENFNTYFKSKAFKNDYKIEPTNYQFLMTVASSENTKNYRFFNEDDLERSFNNLFKGTIQNNNPSWLFFINLSDNNEDLYVVNLLKAFPIRIDNYDLILPQVIYELTSEFANKLGWKLASLYGQIGTPDYKEDQIKNICKSLSKKFFEAIKSDDYTDIVVNRDLFEEAKKAGSSKQPEKLSFLEKVLSQEEKS